jgi:hypothetical protein
LLFWSRKYGWSIVLLLGGECNSSMVRVCSLPKHRDIASVHVGKETNSSFTLLTMAFLNNFESYYHWYTPYWCGLFISDFEMSNSAYDAEVLDVMLMIMLVGWFAISWYVWVVIIKGRAFGKDFQIGHDLWPPSLWRACLTYILYRITKRNC